MLPVKAFSSSGIKFLTPSTNQNKQAITVIQLVRWQVLREGEFLSHEADAKNMWWWFSNVVLIQKPVQKIPSWTCWVREQVSSPHSSCSSISSIKSNSRTKTFTIKLNRGFAWHCSSNPISNLIAGGGVSGGIECIHFGSTMLVQNSNLHLYFQTQAWKAEE